MTGPKRLILVLLLAGSTAEDSLAETTARSVSSSQEWGDAASPEPLMEAAIAEAAGRFGVPPAWIRAVIRAESGFDPRAVSSAGALGLMQLMPDTYAEMRRRHGLGSDPFAIHDNIRAGAAYLREMHDRFGEAGVLASYNAGPGRYAAHLAEGRQLPAETLAYERRVRRFLSAASTPHAGPSAAEPISPAQTAPVDPYASPLFVVRTRVPGPAATDLPDAPSAPARISDPEGGA